MSFSELIQVTLLAVIQGIAEFLPISSSGHLVVLGKVFERWFGDPADGPRENIVLNLTLHLGTLAAILVVYRRDLWGIWRRPRLCLAVVLATIPAVVAGVVLKKYIEATFEMPLVVACGWLVTAGLLSIGQRVGHGHKTLDEITAKDAIIIGCFQAVSALFRGVSRSGSTIAGGLLNGASREAAAGFSFLMAIPVIVGAAVLEAGVPLLKAYRRGESLSETATGMLGGYSPWALLLGGLISFVVGWVSLRWLIRIIVQRGLNWFVWYVLAASALTFLWQGYEHFVK
ncbi:MAG: undecaprenyl-diphosphate phosphatase [Planctomycetes bacterium]|nr:undecaprenyl-diphosphate phosphatase [Planctomycetota bacterium]